MLFYPEAPYESRYTVPKPPPEPDLPPPVEDPMPPEPPIDEPESDPTVPVTAVSPGLELHGLELHSVELPGV